MSSPHNPMLNLAPYGTVEVKCEEASKCTAIAASSRTCRHGQGVNNPKTLFWEGTPQHALVTPQGPHTSFSLSYLMQARDETRRETGEPKALLNGGEAALEVGTVEELGELEKPVAQHKHLRAKEKSHPS